MRSTQNEESFKLAFSLGFVAGIFALTFFLGYLAPNSESEENATPTDDCLCECTSGDGGDTSTTPSI